MNINVNYDYRGEDVRKALDVEALARHVIVAEGNPDTTEVSVSFVTDEEIRALNCQWRGLDKPTDVLSFECDGFDDDFAPDGEQDCFELGDVVVAVDVATRQAPTYGLSFADELSLLVTHGLLHLCGYDHMEPAEAEVMEERERVLLSEFWNRPFKRYSSEP